MEESDRNLRTCAAPGAPGRPLAIAVIVMAMLSFLQPLFWDVLLGIHYMWAVPGSLDAVSRLMMLIGVYGCVVFAWAALQLRLWTHDRLARNEFVTAALLMAVVAGTSLASLLLPSLWSTLLNLSVRGIDVLSLLGIAAGVLLAVGLLHSRLTAHWLPWPLIASVAFSASSHIIYGGLSRLDSSLAVDSLFLRQLQGATVLASTVFWLGLAFCLLYGRITTDPAFEATGAVPDRSVVGQREQAAVPERGRGPTWSRRRQRWRRFKAGSPDLARDPEAPPAQMAPEYTWPRERAGREG